ncbi:hypothetical protein HYU14_05290 [Candidatus Woesearchaeota archaeon]|nr:hypothetical protein [Candidatus Woesearchaeota archaeon]
MKARIVQFPVAAEKTREGTAGRLGKVSIHRGAQPQKEENHKEAEIEDCHFLSDFFDYPKNPWLRTRYTQGQGSYVADFSHFMKKQFSVLGIPESTVLERIRLITRTSKDALLGYLEQLVLMNAGTVDTIATVKSLYLPVLRKRADDCIQRRNDTYKIDPSAKSEMISAYEVIKKYWSP